MWWVHAKLGGLEDSTCLGLGFLQAASVVTPACPVVLSHRCLMSAYFASASTASIRVPEELKFPHTCCVGIASQVRLSVLNPADRWLQVSIVALSVSLNGEKVSTAPSSRSCMVRCWSVLPARSTQHVLRRPSLL